MDAQDLVVQALVETLVPAADQVQAAIRYHAGPAKSAQRLSTYHNTLQLFLICAACGAPIAIGQPYVSRANTTGAAAYHIDLPTCLGAVQAIVQLAFETAII